MYDAITERIEAGQRWLDEHEPGWQAKIDTESLSLELPTRCVIGQIAGGQVGNYWRFIHRHGLSHEQLMELGFEQDLAYDVEYKQLTAAWLEVL